MKKPANKEPAKNRRMTDTRRLLLEILSKVNRPMTVVDLQKQLKAHKQSPNVTTIYRQLTYLTEQNLVHETSFDGKTRVFEAKHETDHHHAVCTSCNDVIELDIEPVMEAIEQHLKKQGFATTKHIAEFLGECKKCRA